MDVSIKGLFFMVGHLELVTWIFLHRYGDVHIVATIFNNRTSRIFINEFPRCLLDYLLESYSTG